MYPCAKFHIFLRNGSILNKLLKNKAIFERLFCQNDACFKIEAISVYFLVKKVVMEKKMFSLKKEFLWFFFWSEFRNASIFPSTGTLFNIR